jgi:hypothetical protein
MNWMSSIFRLNSRCRYRQPSAVGWTHPLPHYSLKRQPRPHGLINYLAQKLAGRLGVTMMHRLEQLEHVCLENDVIFNMNRIKPEYPQSVRFPSSFSNEPP